MISEEFIKRELYRSTSPKVAGSSLMIVCPFHEDKDPSLGVSLGGRVPAGVWHCLGCKAKGSWNQLAEKIGLKTWNLDSSEESYYVNTSFKLHKVEDEEDLTLEELDDSIKWKKYSNKFLSKFGAKKLWHDKYKDYYLYLPVSYLYERLGYIRVRLNEKSYGPKYWNNFKDKPLYPADYIFNYETPVIILVEGPADALRLIRNKLPALAVLGSSMTDFSKEILEALQCHTIILLFDGDDAGRRAVYGYRNGKRNILGLEQILGNDYKLIIRSPPKGEDPDSMNFDYVLKLKNLFLKSGGKLLGE